jgi:uncharacterized SAM-binding protein YcdF (DUF218 family)
MESKSTPQPASHPGTSRMRGARPVATHSFRPKATPTGQPPRPKSARPKSARQTTHPESAPAWLSVSRGVALFVGAFTLITVFGELRSGGFDANFGWIDLRPCPVNVARGAMALSGIVLLLFFLFPNMPDGIRSFGLLATIAMLAVTIANAIQFARMRRDGLLTCENDLSHSIHLIVALTLCVFGLGSRPGPSAKPIQNLLLMTMAFAVCAITLPLTLFACSQRTGANYDAELIAVVGPTAFSSNDQLIDVLKRIHEPDDQLVVTGLGTDGSELRSMFAAKILTATVDTAGNTLESSVRFTANHAKENGLTRIAVVSDFHQLPRVRKLFRRRGFDVVPVPVGTFQSLPMVKRRAIAEIVAYYGSYADLLMK